MTFDNKETRDAHGRWTSGEGGKTKLMNILKKYKRVSSVKGNDYFPTRITPQDHGIKKAATEAMNKQKSADMSTTKSYRDHQGKKISVTNSKDGGMVFKDEDGSVAATLDKDHVKEISEGMKFSLETGHETAIDKFHSKEGTRYTQAKIAPATESHSGYVNIKKGDDTARETGEYGVKMAYRTAQKIFSPDLKTNIHGVKKAVIEAARNRKKI